MAVNDVIIQPKTPASGADQGNQSNVYFNVKIDGVVYVPVGTTDTFNGGKVRDGAIRITNGVFKFYSGGQWKSLSNSKIIVTGNETSIVKDNAYGKLTTDFLNKNIIFVCEITPSVGDAYKIPSTMLLGSVLFGFPDPTTNNFTYEITYI